jgi:hypothetical protein
METPERAKYVLQPFEVSEFVRKMTTDPERKQYVNIVYQMLNDLPVNGKIHITTLTKGKDEKLFIQTVCMYHYEIGRGIQFSSDYEYVIKKQLFNFQGQTYY